MTYSHTVLDRFLKYVKIDTQSDPNSATCPSTEKQKDLAKVLVAELQEMGISDAEMDAHGYVYATLPSNSKKQVPVICLCSHIDTSPDCSGTDVQPIVQKNYDGGTIKLPKGGIELNPKNHPELGSKIGMDIVTADGTTLLGADNKAGVAEIMDTVHFFTQNPQIPHGTIRILFTPDEEIGRGANKVDIKKLGADFGYTVDGEKLGSYEDETFSADGVDITIKGINIHPGFAKNAMQNAIKAAATFLDNLPKNRWSPETTEGREGFVHPYTLSGNVEEVKIQFIIRSFVDEELKQYENELEGILSSSLEAYPGCTYEFKVSEQYRNMKNVIDSNPTISAYAKEAIQRAGVQLSSGSIRGGTDGSRLSYMGLPCPNIFAAEYAFHSKMEWTCVQDMQKAVDTLIELVKIWEEKS